jgi:hypothetical protein
MSAATPRTLSPNFRASLGALCMSLAGTCFAQSSGLPPSFEVEARLAAQLEQASPEQLKANYADCSNEAERRLLGSGEAAVCSIIYETLKRRVFGGDFAALLAWSKSMSETRTDSLGAPKVVATK